MTTANRHSREHSRTSRTLGRAALLLGIVMVLAACGGRTVDDAGSGGEEAQPADGAQDEGEATTGEDRDFSEMEEVTFSSAMQQPPTGLRSELLQWWGDEISKRTDGKVNFEFFWAGSLVQPQELLSSIEAGIADVGEASSSYDPTRTPIYQALDLPYNASDYWCGVSVPVELARMEGPLRQEIEGNGVVALTGYSSGTFHLITGDAVDGLDQAKGSRLRTFNDSRGAMWQKVGMEPLVLPLSELFEAVDRGVVDGAEWTVYLTDVLSMYEIIKSFAITDSGMVTGNYVFMSADKWDALPPQAQDVILEVSAEHDQRYARELMELEEELLEKFRNEGVDVFQLSDEDSNRLREAGEEAADEWLEDMEADGHAVRETVDQFNDLMAQCEQRVEDEGYPWEN